MVKYPVTEMSTKIDKILREDDSFLMFLSMIEGDAIYVFNEKTPQIVKDVVDSCCIPKVTESANTVNTCCKHPIITGYIQASLFSSR